MPFKILIISLIALMNTGFIAPDAGSDYSAIYFVLFILGVIFFGISFFSIGVGLAIMAVSMLFSPEISIGSLGLRDISLRLEDLLIPLLVLAWIARIAVLKKGNAFSESPLNKPILCLLTLTVLSTAWGYATGWVPLLPALFTIGKTIEYFVIFYLVLNYIETEAQVKKFLFFALFTVLLLALYTLPQVPKVEIFTENRITAPFEDNPQPATAGGYMALFLIVLLSLYLYEERRVYKICIAVLGIMVFIPFLFTLNRTSYASFIGGIIVVAIIDKRKWLRFIILALLVASPFIAPQAVKDRIKFTWEDGKLERRTLGVDYSFQERILSFQRSWGAIKINPVLGLGVCSWEYPDNQYARTLHELGFLGIAFWLWIYLRLFKMGKWLHGYLKGGVLKGLALGYSAGVIGILLHAMGSVTFYVIRIMEPFWFLSGLVGALYLLKVREFSNAQQQPAEVTA